MTIIIMIVTTTSATAAAAAATYPLLSNTSVNLAFPSKIATRKDTQQIGIADSDGIANLVSKTMTRTDLLRWWSTLSPSFIPPLFLLLFQ